MLIHAKCIILILCSFLQFHIYSLDGFNVTITLFAMIIACLPSILNHDIFGRKGLVHVIGTFWLIFILVAILRPELRTYIPLAIFDFVEYRLYLPAMFSVICLILQLPQHITFFFIILCMISFILYHSITTSEKLENEIKKLRDTSKEKELLIEEKNRRLIEKQDSDIYAATLRERNRIAREIHDNVGHMLTRSILQVGAVKTINKNEVLAQPLEDLHETLNTAMTNIRSSVHDLHDESIDLISAIQEIINNVDNFEIHFQHDTSNNIPKKVKYCFISIIREAVNNAIKHSNATNMDIILQEHPAFYQLLIQDNGTNIDSGVSEGIGLSNMRDRIKTLHGNIKITTDEGFKILISIIKNRSLE